MATVHLRLTIDVVYTANEDDIDTLDNNLTMLADRAYDDGMITNDTDAEIESYTVNVEEIPVQ